MVDTTDRALWNECPKKLAMWKEHCKQVEHRLHLRKIELITIANRQRLDRIGITEVG